jgi:hypothetical protein
MDTSRPLALIPLDDRPDHFHLPVHLARLAGRRMVLPPRELLNRGPVPGQPAALGQWLQHQSTAEAAIVAADMLAYGGWLAAYSGIPSEATAQTHLAALEALRQGAPQVPILAFSALLGPPPALLSPPLPPEEAVRARHRALHQRLIEYLAEGVIDYLLLAPENGCQQPSPTSEQEALQALAARRGVSDRLGMPLGLRAATPLLLARSVLQAHPSPLRVAVRFPNQPGPEAASDPLAQLVRAHLAILGVQPCPQWEEADVVLFVHSQRGDGTAAQGPGKDDSIPGLEWLKEVETALNRGTLVAIADVASPQGADPLLLEELAESIGLPHLAAYAGKGSAGDRLGWALAQGCLVAMARSQAQAVTDDSRKRQVPLVFRRQFQQIARLLQVQKILILLLDPERHRLTPLSLAQGFEPEELAALEFAADSRFWSVALALKSMRLESPGDPDVPESSEVLATLGARNGLIASLLARRFRRDLLLEEERPMGLLCALNKRGGAFTEEDETLLTLLARQTSAILRNIRRSEAEMELEQIGQWLPRAQAQQQLLLTHFLEAWGYQTVVRPRLEQHLPEDIPWWNLGRFHQAVEAQMREQMEAWAQTFLARYWTGQTLAAPSGTCRVCLPERIPCRFSLPWPGTSEIEVEVSLTLEAFPEEK